MKKTIILSTLALLVGCGPFRQNQVTKATDNGITTEHRVKSQNIRTPFKQKYLIKDDGVDVFLIGQKIPTKAHGYSMDKNIEIRTEEGEDFQIPVCTVSSDGQEMFKIEPCGNDLENHANKIDNIFILSDQYKTAENIGLHSTIEEFTTAYPDFTIWFSYVSNRYVIEKGKPFNGVQFILDGNDFMDKEGQKFDSDTIILKPSDFKKNSKIKAIRIWGYGD